MRNKSKILIQFLCLMCICILVLDLSLCMTKVTMLTKVRQDLNPTLKLETEKIIYVSTTGNDSNTGLSEAQAKKTLQSAIDLAQSSINSQNVTIKVGKGHHYITEPINITESQTSGNKKYTLKIEGNNSGLSTLDGGTKITSEWTLEKETEPNIWVTNIGKNQNLSGFYVDGKLKTVAGEELENRNKETKVNY